MKILGVFSLAVLGGLLLFLAIKIFENQNQIINTCPRRKTDICYEVENLVVGLNVLTRLLETQPENIGIKESLDRMWEKLDTHMENCEKCREILDYVQ